MPCLNRMLSVHNAHFAFSKISPPYVIVSRYDFFLAIHISHA
jgi:hypothetical protein